MFGRHVTMKLKVKSAAELTRINDSKIIPLLRRQKGFRDASLFIAPGGFEAIANSSWDTREDAQAYHTAGYPEALKHLSNVIEGTPIVESFEVADSTCQKAAAKAA
jgi:heme-degrading monooxygenase HmoA